MQRKSRPLQILAVAGWLLNLSVSPATGQITLDGSVCATSLCQLKLIDNQFHVTADLGTTVGTNLFHSFGQFNLTETQTAAFSGPVHIARILARVTGGQTSNIDGTLRSTIPGADFFFVNPAGVMFGPHAKLDVDGSFTVTTADVLYLGDDGLFVASADPADSLLTSAPPSAFGFFGTQPVGVSVQGAALAVPADRSLLIVAGDVDISDSALEAPAGQIHVVSVAGSGEVSFEGADEIAIADVDTFDQLGKVDIRQGSTVNVDGDGGGRVVILGGRLVLTESTITARTLADADGFGVDIATRDQVAIVRGKIDTRSEGGGHGGDVYILTESLVLDARDAVDEVGIFTDSLGVSVPPQADLRVTLDITHSFDSDINAFLESPNGTFVLLFSGVGVGGDDFAGTVLDDRADIPIFEGFAPFIGVFQPMDSFSAFIDELVQGQWVLEIEDVFDDDDGVLNGWSLQIGDMEFQSTDVGQVISGHQAPVRSTLSVDVPDLVVTGNEGFTPGFAGAIHIESEIVQVFGPAALSATTDRDTLLPGNNIAVTAPTVILNGEQAEFVETQPGVGEFVALGRVVVDGSLGPVRVLQGPDFQITADLGLLAGGNLFHSFSQFDLSSTQAATFSGPDHVTHILARITGDGASNINGEIVSTIDGANLLIMNPHGVVFGSSAALLIVEGSFVVTTAEVLHLADGGQFSASVDPIESVLTSAPPGEFGFLGGPDALVVAEHSVLSNQHTISIKAGSVEIGGNAALFTDGPGDVDILASHHITLSGGSEIRTDNFVEDGVNGSVRLEAPVVELLDGFVIDTSSFGFGSGGDVEIIASERIVFSGTDDFGLGAAILSTDFDGGGAGSVRLEAPVVVLMDGSTIDTSTISALGPAGNIDIMASERIALSQSAIVAVTASAGGDAGSIHLEAPTIALRDSSIIDTSTFGVGAGGDVVMIASKEIVVSQSSIHAAPTFFADGDAGSIHLEAPIIRLVDQALIDTSTDGPGPGGDITMIVSEGIFSSDSTITAKSVSDGDAGSIRIDAPVIELTNQATISTKTEDGLGRGGDIMITADDRLVLSGSAGQQVTAGVVEASSSSDGDAGSITILAPDVHIANGLQITTSSSSTGDGGAIRLDVAQLEITAGATIAARSDGVVADAGTAGTIDIVASESVVLADESVVTTTSAGLAKGGDITVSAGHSLELKQSQVSAQAAQDGGNVALNAPFIIRLVDSVVTAEAGNNGGNIAIDPLLVDLQGQSIITANALSGDGGNIAIQTAILRQSSGSEITASSQFGRSGLVNISATLNLTGSLVPVSGSLLDIEAQLQPRCEVHFGSDSVSSFVVSGRGGTPVVPGRWLPSVDLAGPARVVGPNQHRTPPHSPAD